MTILNATKLTQSEIESLKERQGGGPANLYPSALPTAIVIEIVTKSVDPFFMRIVEAMGEGGDIITLLSQEGYKVTEDVLLRSSSMMKNLLDPSDLILLRAMIGNKPFTKKVVAILLDLLDEGWTEKDGTKEPLIMAALFQEDTDFYRVIKENKGDEMSVALQLMSLPIRLSSLAWPENPRKSL